MKGPIGSLNPNERNVFIWGAGFSGLVLGYYLKSLGYRVTIYEKSDRAGGKIMTRLTSLGPVETGANALFMNVDCMDLLKELNLEPLPATRKLRRLIYTNGRPSSPFTSKLFFKLALRSGRKPPLVHDGLTVAEFFRPLLGQSDIDQILSPALGGVYAASAEQLLFKSVFSDLSHHAQFKSYRQFISLLRKLRKNQPRMEVRGSVSFDGGMQTLIDRLAHELRNEIKLNYQEPFRVRGNTIICTDAYSASVMTKELYPAISAELARIRYQSLSTVTVFLKREIKSLQRAFGVLIPSNQGLHSSGVINNKAIFPSNIENVYSYTFIGKKEVTKEEIISDIKLLHKDFDPEDLAHMVITFWEKAIPLYDIQRFLSVKKLQHLAAAEGNLAFFGNYVSGISLREMVSGARAFAQDPLRSMRS